MNMRIQTLPALFVLAFSGGCNPPPAPIVAEQASADLLELLDLVRNIGVAVEDLGRHNLNTSHSWEWTGDCIILGALEGDLDDRTVFAEAAETPCGDSDYQVGSFNLSGSYTDVIGYTSRYFDEGYPDYELRLSGERVEVVSGEGEQDASYGVSLTAGHYNKGDGVKELTITLSYPNLIEGKHWYASYDWDPSCGWIGGCDPFGEVWTSGKDEACVMGSVDLSGPEPAFNYVCK
jgi:hypothetical protein